MSTFIYFIFKSHRARTAFWLALSVFICFGLITLRIHVSGNRLFLFLVWNLFLAVIPYAVSTVLAYHNERKGNRLFIMGGAALWLLFFPNAPYILTDLFHLRPRIGVPLWFDLVLILSFAWSGLMLGFASLADMQYIISRTFNKITGWLFVFATMFLTGFGIYLGRFERWNSWDIVSQPRKLAFDIINPVLHPFAYSRVWFITLAFAVFLTIGYFTIKQLGKISIAANGRN